MISFSSPCCFKEPDDTSWHVEEEEGEDDYRHHPGHDDNNCDDGDHPDDDDNHPDHDVNHLDDYDHPCDYPDHDDNHPEDNDPDIDILKEISKQASYFNYSGSDPSLIEICDHLLHHAC